MPLLVAVSGVFRKTSSLFNVNFYTFAPLSLVFLELLTSLGLEPANWREKKTILKREQIVKRFLH